MKREITDLLNPEKELMTDYEQNLRTEKEQWKEEETRL
jgi:hypothetical protein